MKTTNKTQNRQGLNIVKGLLSLLAVATFASCGSSSTHTLEFTPATSPYVTLDNDEADSLNLGIGISISY